MVNCCFEFWSIPSMVPLSSLQLRLAESALRLLSDGNCLHVGGLSCRNRFDSGMVFVLCGLHSMLTIDDDGMEWLLMYFRKLSFGYLLPNSWTPFVHGVYDLDEVRWVWIGQLHRRILRPFRCDCWRNWNCATLWIFRRRRYLMRGRSLFRWVRRAHNYIELAVLTNARISLRIGVKRVIFDLCCYVYRLHKWLGRWTFSCCCGCRCCGALIKANWIQFGVIISQWWLYNRLCCGFAVMPVLIYARHSRGLATTQIVWKWKPDWINRMQFP